MNPDEIVKGNRLLCSPSTPLSLEYMYKMKKKINTTVKRKNNGTKYPSVAANTQQL